MTTQDITNLAVKIKKTTDWTERNKLVSTIPTEFPHQIEAFIREILNKTTNHSNWITAINLAREQNNTSVWSTIIFELMKLTKKKNQPTWTFSVLSSIATDVIVESYNLKHLFKAYIQGDNSYFIFSFIIPSGKFTDGDISKALRENVNIMSDATMEKVVVSVLSDWFEITYFLKAISSIDRRRYMSTKLLQSLIGSHSLEIAYYNVDDFMKEFKDLFTTPEIINYLVYLIVKKSGPDTVDIFLDMISNLELNNNFLESIYTRLYSITENNETLNSELFKISDDDKYLPATVKDVFLF